MSLPATLPADLTASDVWRPVPTPDIAKVTASPSGSDAWGEDGFTFSDLLDVINPLQHIPVLSTLYRQITGDEIAPAAKFIGSTLLGGVPGLAVATLNAVIEDNTGRDIGETVLAALSAGDSSLANPATAIASVDDIPPAKLAMTAKTPVSNQDMLDYDNATAPAQLANFFAPRPGGGVQQALGPGAIQNKLFRPLAELQMAAALSSTASTAELALKPVEKAPQTVKPTTPLQTATDKLSPTDAKRIAANRASLLSLAQDLRGMIQGRDADKALTGGVLKHPQ